MLASVSFTSWATAAAESSEAAWHLPALVFLALMLLGLAGVAAWQVHCLMGNQRTITGLAAEDARKAQVIRQLHGKLQQREAQLEGVARDYAAQLALVEQELGAINGDQARVIHSLRVGLAELQKELGWGEDFARTRMITPRSIQTVPTVRFRRPKIE
jgi:hypothetical protein